MSPIVNISSFHIRTVASLYSQQFNKEDPVVSFCITHILKHKIVIAHVLRSSPSTSDSVHHTNSVTRETEDLASRSADCDQVRRSLPSSKLYSSENI